MPKQDTATDMRQRIAYYAAGFVASAVGPACFATVLSTNTFIVIALVALATGYTSSWLSRAKLVPRARVEIVTLMLLLAFLAAITVIRGFHDQVLPPETTESTDMFMGVVLIWMMIACSFRLTNDRAVLFMCVPSLSLVGLSGTFSPDMESVALFGIFLAAACFILVRQNAFAYQDEASQSRGAIRLSAGSMKLHIGITASVTLVALVVGTTLGTLLYPSLVNSFTQQMAPFDSAQLVEQLVGEEYVPVATGPVGLSTQEVMTVKCDRYLLFRGRTYNKYTGRGWISELEPAEQKWVHSVQESDRGDLGLMYSFALPQHPLYETGSETTKVEQTISVVSGVYRTIYAASQPRVIKLTSRGNLEPVLRYGSRIEKTPSYGPGSTYTVASRINTASPRQLANASERYPEIIKTRYLGVPETSWQVEKIARRITTNEPNAYRKALAIQGFLQSNFAYDTKAPAAPETEDAVSHFLLKSKRGYCDVFATAMVIMARQSGIPARWVTGFAPGQMGDDGLYHVLAKDRHAWAELYFPGYGWVEFDATPSGADAGLMSRLRETWTMAYADKPFVIAVSIIVLLLAYLIKTEVVDRFRRRKAGLRTRKEAFAAEVSRNYRRMCILMEKAGYPRHPSATPWEYAGMLHTFFDRDLRDLSAAVDTITADFVEFRYSPRDPSPDKLASMSDAVQGLGRLLKSARKRNLLPQSKLA